MNDKIPIFPVEAIKRRPGLALLVYGSIVIAAIFLLPGFNVNYTTEVNHYYSPEAVETP